MDDSIQPARLRPVSLRARAGRDRRRDDQAAFELEGDTSARDAEPTKELPRSPHADVSSRLSDEAGHSIDVLA